MTAERVSPARALAFGVVRATFEDGAFTDVAFREAADAAGLEGRDRAQAQRLAYGAVQRRGTADAVIARLADRSPRLLDPPVAAALWLGLYELLFADATPDHAAVSQSVELAKAGGAGHAAGFVNAILRRAGRERDALRDLLDGDEDPQSAAVAHSVPEWLAALWWEELGPAEARALLDAANRPAERALRVNTLAGDPATALERLRAAGVEAAPAAGAPGAELLAVPEVLVARGSLAGAMEAIGQGLLTPQSRASAAVVEILDPRPGEQVLDLCAGPGIKTGQIGARMEDRGVVISVDSDSARAAEVSAQAERLGLRSVTVIEADATAASLDRTFDRVLVDAPCSDLGTLASRPDVRWRKHPEQLERLASLQAELLQAAVRSLRPGGRLVYSTCTISRRENEDRVAAIASGEDGGEGLRAEDLGARFPGLASPHDARFLQIRPDRDGTSGFFIAAFEREPG